MTTNSTNTSDISGIVDDFPSIWRHTVYGLFLFGQVMSVPCYLFMMYHLLGKRAARKALHNHAIIVMLTYNFITLTVDMSMSMDYLKEGLITPLIPAVCLIHQFVDYGVWYGAIFVMLWTSIERHILIFHSTLVATSRGRLLFHYIPLAIVSLYAPILYFYLICLYPCESVFVATRDWCGTPCYFNTISTWFILCQSFVHYIIPIFLIVMIGIALLLRVFVQKRRLRQAIGWRQHRKMIIQMMLISASYIIFDLPYVVIIIVRWSGIPSFGSNVFLPYISELPLVPAVILPYATLVTLPGVRKKLHALVTCGANR